MATEMEFATAATHVGRVVDEVERARAIVADDGNSVPIVGGRLADEVAAEYDGIVAAAQNLVGILEGLVDELETRAFQCGQYSERVDLYWQQKREWDDAPRETRGEAPVYPPPTAPWMEAS